MTNAFIVGLGGLVGSMARYGVSSLAARLLGGSFPYGTLLVNIAGCFAMGAIAGPGLTGAEDARRLFFTTGLLGGFTTFSAFGHETLLLQRDGGSLAVANIVLNVGAGLGAVALGRLLSSHLAG